MPVDLGQVHLRLGFDAERVDRYAEYLRKTTGLQATRSDAVRALIGKALDAHEAEQKKSKRGSK